MHRDFEGTYGWGGNGSRHLAWELSPAPKGEYPPSVYARHIDEAIKRGDKLFGEPHTYLVAFDPDFEQFIANVAEGLRTYITYRSDGGRYARGLVRDSEEIREIHRRFLRSSVPRGTKVRLQATLWRRKSQIPSGRWALAVHFAADILTFPPDRVEASPAVVEQSRRNHAERVIRIAQSVVKNIDRQNHNQGDRLIKVVQIATRLGYPRFLDLWYYAPDHVRVYMSMRTNNAFLRKMTAATGGRFPFDGSITQSSPTGWRVFPFAKIFKQCLGQDDTTCHAIINNGLLEADSHIFDTIKYANQAAAPGLGGGSALGPLAAQFMEHLASLQASQDNLLSAYKQTTVAKTAGIWATY